MTAFACCPHCGHEPPLLDGHEVSCSAGCNDEPEPEGPVVWPDVRTGALSGPQGDAYDDLRGLAASFGAADGHLDPGHALELAALAWRAGLDSGDVAAWAAAGVLRPSLGGWAAFGRWLPWAAAGCPPADAARLAALPSAHPDRPTSDLLVYAARARRVPDAP